MINHGPTIEAEEGMTGLRGAMMEGLEEGGEVGENIEAGVEEEKALKPMEIEGKEAMEIDRIEEVRGEMTGIEA